MLGGSSARIIMFMYIEGFYWSLAVSFAPLPEGCFRIFMAILMESWQT